MAFLRQRIRKGEISFQKTFLKIQKEDHRNKKRIIGQCQERGWEVTNLEISTAK